MLYMLFPCQYHSTNTLYSVPLSVPFHQYLFSVPPVSTIPPILYMIFPRQYHSTNTLYSVHLSVPFHQYSICCSPVSTIPPILYILFPLSVPFHRYSIFCSPCQYLSTITLYSVPLSVPFYQYSIFCSPVSTIVPILYILFPRQYCNRPTSVSAVFSSSWSTSVISRSPVVFLVFHIIIGNTLNRTGY